MYLIMLFLVGISLCVELKKSDPEESVPFKFTQNNSFLQPALFETLSNVHQTLVKGAYRPFRGRLLFMKHLQNNLLNDIKKRSQFLWKDLEDARGQEYMSFPSLESALLTISFLTFAVFLIKIVKQFIQGLQGAHATTMVGIDMTGTTIIPAKVVRHKRQDAASRILQYIEEFKLQHNLDDTNTQKPHSHKGKIKQ